MYRDAIDGSMVVHVASELPLVKAAVGFHWLGGEGFVFRVVVEEAFQLDFGLGSVEVGRVPGDCIRGIVLVFV